MKCNSGIGECKLEIKPLENGDVLEYCTVCNFQYLHQFKNIKNNHLNPHKAEK